MLFRSDDWNVSAKKNVSVEHEKFLIKLHFRPNRMPPCWRCSAAFVPLVPDRLRPNHNVGRRRGLHETYQEDFVPAQQPVPAKKSDHV